MLRDALELIGVALIAMLLVFFLASVVHAHTVLSAVNPLQTQTITYPSGCCGGGDCAPVVSPDSIGVTALGVEILLHPGEHPMVKEKSFRGRFPLGKVKASPDGGWHVCLGVVYRDSKPNLFIRCLLGPMSAEAPWRKYLASDLP